jgi:uncharacterized paraquat-inducible protein A
MRLWGSGPLLTTTETRFRWGVLIGFPLSLVLAVVASISGQSGGVVATALPASLLFFAIAAICTALLRRRLYASLARLRADRFRHCPGCQYDLRPLPDCGRCPECGWRYSPGSLQETWTARYTDWLERVTQNDEN